MPSVPPPDPADQPAPPDPSDVPAPPATPPTTGSSDEAKWPIWTAPAAVAMGFGIGVFVSVIVGAIASVNGSSLSHPSPAVSLISDVLFDLAFVGSAIFFSRVRGRPGPADFGFRRVRPRTAIVAVIVSAIGYYIVTALYASALNLHGNDKLPRELGVGKSTAALVGATVFVCVVAPIVEEFFFRGFIFGALRRMRIIVAGRDLGAWVAAAITGVLFGLAHTGSASSQYLVPLGFLGFVLCLLRWKTGSLYPCMALHSLNNSIALGYGQLHWNAGEILGLMAGSLLVITAITGPLADRAASIRGLGHAR
jgi:membrane protease YdiL (CAAX protease family)